MTVSQRTAKWILALACLVFTVCFVHRSLNPVVEAVVPIHTVSQQSDVNVDASADKTCALSAKSLSSVPPLLDTMLPFLLLLLTLAGMMGRQIGPLRPESTPFPPLRRLHLTHCVFRE